MKRILLLVLLASATLRAEPSLQMTSAPSSVQSGTSYYIEASCWDNMGGVSVTIYKNDNYFASSYGTSPVYVGGSTTDYGAQTVVYRIEAVNDYYETDTIYHYVTITQPNNAPTIQWVTAPGSVPINQSFTVQARGMDQDGNLTNVFVWREWTPFAFNGGGNGYENTSDGNTYSQGSAGTVTFQAQAQDSNSATSSVIYHTVTIYVPNQAPTITWINYPASAYVNDAFYIQARGDDANGNLAWVYVWKEGNPFAFNGGGNGYQGYSDNNSATGTVPGTIQFSAQSGDSASAVSSTIYHTVTINNRAPNTPTISASGTGVTDMGNGQFSIYNEPPNNQITIGSTMVDPDRNLTNHTIYYQQVTGANPDPGGWIALTSGTPSDPYNSSVSTTQTMLTPGRWDFHVNGHDGYLSSGGASLTLYVYGLTNNATFISQVIDGQTNPSSLSLNNGQTVAATITMRNTGTKPWDNVTTPHKLGSQSPQDNTNWGLNRVVLPSTPINPPPQSGDTAVFSFNLTASNTPGIYTCQWRMVEEDIGWFGTASTAVTITVNDTISPSTPSNLQSTGKTHNSVSLSWGASTDNSGSVSYAIYRNGGGTPIGTATGLTYTDTALNANTEYRYTVMAYDATNHYSPASNLITVTTDADPNADDDGDGMTNTWENYYFGNPTAVDPNADPDGDGLTNIAEYNLGGNTLGGAHYRPNNYDAGTSALGGTVPAGWPNAPGSSTYVVGMTAGSLAVDKNGAATYTVPLWVVPGTAGMEPKLALNYSSQAGAGWLGHGWSLSGLSAITRGPQTKALDGNITGVSFTTSDRFYLDGQRLVAISGTYGNSGTEYRTEIDSISKIVSYNYAGSGPAWFMVWTKSGLIIELGNTTDSAVDAQERSEKVSWAVNKISDTSGNYMEFVYSENTSTGEHRIERINYTRNDGSALSHYASVRFTYENRSDAFSGYVAGSKVSRTQRIKNIGMYYGDTKVREYVADYIERAHTGRSILTTLHEKDGSGAEYPPLTFEYDETLATGIWDQSLSSTWAPPAIMGEQGAEPKGTGFIDLNGDGRPDFVQYHVSSGDPGTTLERTARLNDPVNGWVLSDGTGGSEDYRPPAPLAHDGVADSGARFVDLNHDGLVDFVNLNNGYAYINTPGTGWVYSSSWSFPTPTISSELLAAAVENLREILLIEDPLTQITTNVSAYYGSLGSFIDVDGDGLPDFVGNDGTYVVDGQGGGNATTGYGGTYQPAMMSEGDGWRNNGSGWERQTGYGGVSERAKGTRFIDVNADGKPDSVQHWYGNSSTVKSLYLGTGSGWSEQSPTSSLIPSILLNAGTVYQENAPVGTELADLNGDGLVDLIARNDSSGTPLNSAYLGTGTGWVSAAAFLSPLELTHDNTPQGAALMDINTDGLVDIVQGLDSYVREVRLGSGHGWSSAVSAFNLIRQIYQPNIGYNGTDFVDINADGAIDQVWHWKPTGGSAVSGVALNNAKPADRLNRVTNGFGVAAQITYAPLTERSGASFTVYDKGTGGPNNTINVIGPMYVVKSVSNDDGVGGQYSVNYRYGGLRTHLTRGNLGFAWMEVSDSRTNIVTTTNYKQEYPYIGMVDSTLTEHVPPVGSSTTLSATSITYADKNSSGDVRLPYAHVVTQSFNDLDGAAISSSTTTTQIDAYGNATPIVVDTGGGYSKTTTNTYTDNVGLWLLGRLTNSTVSSAAPSQSTLTRTSSFTYHGTSGLLLTETVEPGDSTLALTTTYVHDAFGNRTSVTVSGAGIVVGIDGDVSVSGTVSRQTTYDYDAKGRFLDWKRVYKDGSNYHQESYTYNQALGVLESLTGPNDLTTDWTYNSFGVRTGEARADDTLTAWTLRWAGSGAPTGAHTSLEVESTGSAPLLTFNDNFGRAIRVLAINGDGTIVSRQTVYDHMGRAYATSNPYRTGDTIYWTVVPIQAAPSTEREYDALNRPLKVQTPHDSSPFYVTTSYNYHGRETSVTDAKGRVTRTTVNSQGLTTEAVRNFGGAANETGVVSYGYDALGNLTSTVAGGVTTTLAYDLRGRKTAMTDPDMGTWQYRYNIFGELIWQKDAKSQITTLAYDGLGRLISRVEPEGTTTWTYDSSSAGGAWKGKLHTVTAPGGYSETNNYDGNGRPVTTTKVIDTVPYATSTAYDGAGRVNKLVYPATGLSGSPFTLRQVYNAFGSLKELRYWKDSDTDTSTDPDNIDKTIASPTGKVYWEAESYDVSGRIDGESYGNGLINYRGYSPATGRLHWARIDRGYQFSLEPLPSSFTVQNLDYSYDPMGNVNVRHETAPGFAREERFYTTNPGDGYDGLDRLKVHTVVGGASVNVSYDALGNITDKSGVGSYTYHGTRVHAVTAAGSRSYTYDANGNMLTGGTSGNHSYDWTSFNQVKKITDSVLTKSTEFAFGASHERVKQVRKTGDTVTDTTIYVGGLYEKVTAGSLVTHKHYILAPTGRVAVFTDRSDYSHDLRFFHTDGLGSITVVSDEAGRVLKRYTYDAWGKQSTSYTNNGSGITNQAPTTRGFTDHEELSDFGLVHMNGRVYDPTLGRFLSADPFVGDVSDAQDFNRYSYLSNNPLSGTDPSGFFGLRDVVKIVAVVAVAYFSGGWGANVIGSWLNSAFAVTSATGTAVTAGIGGGLAAGFSSGFAGSLLNGGSLGDAFKTGVIGGVVGAVTGGVLGKIGATWGNANFGSADWVQKSIAHGLVHGEASEAQGGSFRHGFYSGVFAGASEGVIASAFDDSQGLQYASAAVAGGTGSVLGGGKFTNGAVSGAFSYMFNQMSGARERRRMEGMQQEELSEGQIKALEAKGVAGKNLRIAERASLPIQRHHLISWLTKKFNFQEHPLVKAAKVNLRSDPRNLVDVAGHSGRHWEQYHETVETRMNFAWKSVQAGRWTPDRAMDVVWKSIIRDINSGKLLLYENKQVTIP